MTDDDPRAQLAALPDAACREILEVLLDNPSPTLIGIIAAMTMRRRAEQMTVEAFDREERRPTKEDGMEQQTTVLCPYCRHAHDLRVLISGDVLICRCGTRLRVQHNGDGTSSLWPERRGEERPRAICRMCGAAIEYIGPYWDHIGENKPRHPATPTEEG